jgi:hypothetical protein
VKHAKIWKLTLFMQTVTTILKSRLNHVQLEKMVEFYLKFKEFITFISLGCYQFDSDAHCFKSVKSDTWWDWCALELQWSPCLRNNNPDFTCDEITEMTTESTELTTETFLDNYAFCRKLKTDLDYTYCCTFCDEPFEQCVSGEGLTFHRKSFIKNIKAVISLDNVVINRRKVIRGWNGVLRKCRPGNHATKILFRTKKFNAKMVFVATTETVNIYKFKFCHLLFLS